MISISGTRSLGGGGVVAYIFFSGNSRSKSSKQIFEERNNINSLQEKKHLPKVWGGMAPVAPPGYATGHPAGSVLHFPIQLFNWPQSGSNMRASLVWGFFRV